MSHAEITMKSGAVVHFDTTEITVGKAPGGGLFRLKWQTPDGSSRALMHVNLDEIAAVVFIDDDSGAVS